MRRLPIALMSLTMLLPAGCVQDSARTWSTKSQSTVLAIHDQPLANPLDPADGAQAGAVRQAALRILHQATESSSELLRANALEALQAAPNQIEPVVSRLLTDENRGVRFVAAMTVGKLQLTRLAHVLQPLLHDESQSVQAAAMYALHRCGQKPDLDPLARMLQTDDPEVKGNVAMILGELGEPSAIEMLRQALGRGLQNVSPLKARLVDLQLAEAMVKLGAVEELDGIRAALFTPAERGELTALACLTCGRLGDQRSLPNLLDLATRTGRRQPPAEIRMAAVLAVAQIDPAQAPAEVAASYLSSDRYQWRMQAALTLGEVGDSAFLPSLAAMLSDPNPLVQVAAAGAILRLQPR